MQYDLETINNKISIKHYQDQIPGEKNDNYYEYDFFTLSEVMADLARGV